MQSHTPPESAVWERNMDIDAELAAVKQAYARARGAKRDELLFAALLMSYGRPLPEWAFNEIAKLLAARRPKTSDVKMRWIVARALLDWGHWDPTFQQTWQRWKSLGWLTEEERAWDEKPPLKWEEVWTRASEILRAAGRPAKPETIRKSYALYERSLPPAQRRPLTWRRH
jgi:hypothetical protein